MMALPEKLYCWHYSPTAFWISISIGIGLGGILATLSKENGILLVLDNNSIDIY